jgi:type VI secretion system protein ImpL
LEDQPLGESGPDIFLSYAREDEAHAHELATALGQRGFSVFWDREVPPGATWHSHIGEALANAKCVVVVWSRHSIASDWVLEEASEGKRRKVLVPVLFEAVQPPFGFGGIQAASLINWRPSRSSPAFDGLMNAIRRIVGGNVGSGTEPEPALPKPCQPASSKSALESAQLTGLATPSPGLRESHAVPVTWTHRTIAKIAAVFVVLLVVGGSLVALRLGLLAGGAPNGGADTAYLEHIFLPRLVLRVEQHLRERINDPEFVLQGLKVYLMLTGRAELDRELIEAWFSVVDRPEAEGLTAAELGRLTAHRAALLDLLPEITDHPEPDATLVARAQQTLNQVPRARLAYAALLNLPEVGTLPAWNPAEHAGPNAPRVLTRRSGKPLSEGIPGIFTYDGFHEQVLRHLRDVARATAVDNWMLDARAPTKGEVELLQRDILYLYYDDYIAVWDQLLADVTLAPLTDLRSAVYVLKDLAGPNSAIKLLLSGIHAEVDLTRMPETSEMQEAAGVAALKEAQTKLLGKLGGAGAELAVLARSDAVPGAPVARHFAYLADLIKGAEGAPPLIDDATRALRLLFQELQSVSTSPNPEKAMLERGALAGVVGPLAEEAKRLPPPLDDLFGTVALQTTAIGGGAVARQLNAIWQADVLPFCTKALAGRFPFHPDSAIDVSLDDFGRLFAPGGLIDGFINANLQSFVDTTRRPWRWRGDLDLSNAALAQFERARLIRDGTFADGARPKAGFMLRPVDADADTARVLLDLDGQQVSYTRDPPHPVPMVWPGPSGTNLVRLTFFPVFQAVPVEVTREGDWSWFRLLREGAVEPSDQPDLFHLTLSAGGHWARFELRAASVYNPFDLDLLGSFRCPSGI